MKNIFIQIILKEGTDVTIFATGQLVCESLEAAKTLAEQGKPLMLSTIKKGI